jgi:uncharacterized protein (TIGR02679 family)
MAIHLIERAQAVLGHLPANGVPRAQLAAETLGDAHALDNGQATATLVLAVLRRQYAEPQEEEEKDREERIRDIWARAGIMVNALARPALFLNLPIPADERTGWTPGEPAYISLRQLLRTPSRWRVAGLTVFVCENPNFLAIAADTLGSHCAPLVCTDGMPAAAQRTLLTQLAKAGARLLYHGDFDWPGIGIANYVLRAYGACPWRLSASDYEVAAKDAPHIEKNLIGPAVIACWDPALTTSMQDYGLAIAEEALASSLLADLRI